MWDFISKALTKSRRIASICVLLSNAVIQSWMSLLVETCKTILIENHVERRGYCHVNVDVSYAHLAHLDGHGVGLVLLLHSFRSRVTSWETLTAIMSSFICSCLAFLGRPRRLEFACVVWLLGDVCDDGGYLLCGFWTPAGSLSSPVPLFWLIFFKLF